MSGHRRHRRHVHHEPTSLLSALARSIDELGVPPEQNCPKCASSVVGYYDPFLNLWRTFGNRRRLRCHSCGFVWRRSRNAPIPQWTRFFDG